MNLLVLVHESTWIHGLQVESTCRKSMNPRVDLGFVFMSMGAFWTHVTPSHVIFIFYEYTIVRASSSNPAPSLCIFFTIYRTYTLHMPDFFQRGLTGTDGHRGSQGCLRWQTVHRRPI